MLVFCPDFTRRSYLAPEYLVSLDELCQRDYGESYFPSSIICLDLDSYETAQSGDNDATMDASIGIANYGNNRVSYPRHLLVELRIDYKTTNNFDYRNMVQKVSHSRAILSPEPIDSIICFIFSTQLAPKAKNDFSRRARQDKSIALWNAMSTTDFLNLVHDSSSLPYQPVNDMEAIRRSLDLQYGEGGVDKADIQVKYWMEMMDKYEQRYMRAENDLIASVLISFLESLSFPAGSIEDEFIKLRIDDIKRYKSDYKKSNVALTL